MSRRPSIFRVPSVWVVEIRHAGQPTWMPTVGVALEREWARLVLADWKQRNPNDRFRLRRYARVAIVRKALA